jgi:hypothetical protein
MILITFRCVCHHCSTIPHGANARLEEFYSISQTLAPSRSVAECLWVRMETAKRRSAYFGAVVTRQPTAICGAAGSKQKTAAANKNLRQIRGLSVVMAVPGFTVSILPASHLSRPDPAALR